MLCFPNGKINLGLYVTRKRADGYHDLETIFYPVASSAKDALRDVIEIIPATETKMHLSGLEVTGDVEHNLVWKAYQLLAAAFPGKIQAVDIYLHKVLPMGAGLGGGSADGAFMLRLLNDFFQLQLSNEQLAAFALQLGSDCPFFIYNTPQFATGRGEQMSAVDIDLTDHSLQLICPRVHVSTAAAFGMLQPEPAAFDLRKLGELPVKKWKDHVSNDFEGPVFRQHPDLAAIKEQLYQQGAIYASMSGSGSALYGLFPKGKKAEISTDTAFDAYYIE